MDSLLLASPGKPGGYWIGADSKFLENNLSPHDYGDSYIRSIINKGGYKSVDKLHMVHEAGRVCS